MAELTKKILGEPKGTVGNLLFKGRYGKTRISALPKKYKKTKSVRLVDNRKKFAERINFAKVINKSPLLKSVWNSANLPGKNSYYKILKGNYPFTSSEYVLSSALITPENISLDVSNISLDENSLSVDFIPSTVFIESFNFPLYAVALLYLFNPENISSKHKEVFINIEEEIDSFDFIPNVTNKFTFQTETSSFEVLNEYKNAIVYFAFVSMNTKNKVPVWTTGTGQFVKGQPPEIKSPLPKPKDSIPYPKKSFKITYV